MDCLYWVRLHFIEYLSTFRGCCTDTSCIGKIENLMSLVFLFWSFHLFLYRFSLYILFGGVSKKVCATIQEPVLSFHYVGPEGQNSSIRSVSKDLCTLSHYWLSSISFICVWCMCIAYVHVHTCAHTHSLTLIHVCRSEDLTYQSLLSILFETWSLFVAGFPSHQGSAGITITGCWVQL